LAKDARDCLEMCLLLHTNQEHPDDRLLEHTKELIAELEAAGFHPSPLDPDELTADDGDEDAWEDDDDDVEMS